MPLFTGSLVKLVAGDAEIDSKLLAQWNRDSEFARLFDAWIVRPQTPKSLQPILEEDIADELRGHNFRILTRAEDKPIGVCGLFIIWEHGDAFVAIGLGERDYWGKGYGTDAMRVLLHYAFTELNLHRITLNVFAYNPRAIRSYEKCGFQHEGRQRGYLNRDGQRWDMIYMGILKHDWKQLQTPNPQSQNLGV